MIATNKTVLFMLVVAMALMQWSCKKDSQTDGNDNSSNPFGCDGISESIMLEKGTYRINCMIRIYNDAELTIAPGTRFEMGKEGGFINQGGLIRALGTADEPIVFTGQTPEPGAWISLDIAHNKDNAFRHCIFEYGGGDGPRSMVRVGGDNGEVGKAFFQNCTFRYGAKNGLFVNVNSVIEGLMENRFEGNAEYPIRMAFENINELQAGNTYVGNGKQMIEVNNSGGLYRISLPVTFNKIELPYYIHPSCSLKEFVGTFEVLPGVTWLMGKDAALNIYTSTALECNGTPNERITIRGLEDVPGYWDGIFILGSYGRTNTFYYTDISNGGSGASDSLGLHPGTIASYLGTQGDNTYLIFKNSSISKSGNWGIFIGGRANTINGIRYDHGDSTDMVNSLLGNDNVFNNNASGNVYLKSN